MNAATRLAITNPLVKYRSLVATKSIKPDPEQHRLAIHLEKLYDDLKDYKPSLDYSHRLSQVNDVLNMSKQPGSIEDVPRQRSRVPGFWKTILGKQSSSSSESVALARILTSHEEAMEVSSPKGLLLHGEVGTGKSMLIDLFAESLPTKRKRRWHYNTFMLQMISQLEQYRLEGPSLAGGEYSLLRLARNMIYESPILFLDEFQLPDRMAAKILSNLMTIFFRLGGVLVATSNRLPDELAKAAGLEYPSSSPLAGVARRAASLPANTEFADFLELLKARCDVWQLEGGTDYRRQGGNIRPKIDQNGLESENASMLTTAHTETPENIAQDVDTASDTPRYYILTSTTSGTADNAVDSQTTSLNQVANALPLPDKEKFTTSSVKVFGRTIGVPRVHDGVSIWTFDELCAARYGPADYITLASTFHTFIILKVPVLTAPLKNEARRFITLLDALYEAKCKLLTIAAAKPDSLFFPDLRSKATQLGDPEDVLTLDEDALHAETFAEMHQDLTSPFRPNISSYHDGQLAHDALEDDPPNRIRREAMPGATEMERLERLGSRPNFTDTSYFTGEDEKFAYKRAVSRIWEMCGDRWWSSQQWSPLPLESRHWERSRSSLIAESPITVRDVEVVKPQAQEFMGETRHVSENEDEFLFRDGASPFRTQPGPPPRINKEHVWGVQTWGKKAGPWGQGVEGLKNRHKDKE